MNHPLSKKKITTDRSTEMVDYVFRDLGTPKREDLEKYRNMIFIESNTSLIAREVKSAILFSKNNNKT
jgi:hypothetical protein